MLALTSDGVSTCLKRPSLQFAARRGSCHAEKAVRRLHHPPPDGFAKLLGGENFGSSIPALHFGGKTAMTRPFHGYAQLGCLTLGFRFRELNVVRDKSGLSTAQTQSDAADGLIRTLSSRGPVALGRLTSSTCIAIQASIDVISVILIYLLVGSSLSARSAIDVSKIVLRVDQKDNIGVLLIERPLAHSEFS